MTEQEFERLATRVAEKVFARMMADQMRRTPAQFFPGLATAKLTASLSAGGTSTALEQVWSGSGWSDGERTYSIRDYLGWDISNGKRVMIWDKGKPGWLPFSAEC